MSFASECIDVGDNDHMQTHLQNRHQPVEHSALLTIVAFASKSMNMLLLEASSPMAILPLFFMYSATASISCFDI